MHAAARSAYAPASIAGQPMPPPDAREDDVSRVMAEIDNAIGCLNEHTAKLMDRLGPVLYPAVPSAGAELKAVKPASAPLIESLDAFAARLRELDLRIGHVVERLAL